MHKILIGLKIYSNSNNNNSRSILKDKLYYNSKMEQCIRCNNNNIKDKYNNNKNNKSNIWKIWKVRMNKD